MLHAEVFNDQGISVFTSTSFLSIAEIKVCHPSVAHLTLIGYCLTPDKDIIFVF